MVNAAQVLLKKGILVSLGDKEYTIKLRSVRKADEWKEQFHKVQTQGLDIAGQAGLNTEDIVSLEQGNVKLDTMELIKTLSEFGMMKQPKAYLDLFFAYDETLPREEIEESASVFEIANALKDVIECEYPFGKLINQAMQK